MISLGLSMIVKDEVEEVSRLVQLLSPYIEQAFITVTHKSRFSDFETLATKNPKIKISYFKWQDDFALARNYNLEQITTSHFIWLDSDDTLLYPEELPKLLNKMHTEQLDGIYLPYDYMQNEDGDCIAWHYRERILRASPDWRWVGAVHESLIYKGTPKLEKYHKPIVKHQKELSEVEASSIRNHLILEKEYQKSKKPDPRITHYLGLSYFMRKDYDKAIKLLLEHIKTSGWDEERYRSWCKIAEAHILTGNLAKANSACNAGIDLLPNYPEAYFIKVDIYYLQQDYERAYEWLLMGLSHPQPSTMSIIDPNKQVRAMLAGIHCLTVMGKPIEAYGLLQDVLKLSPNNSQALKIKPAIEMSYLETKAIDWVKLLARYYHQYGGDIEGLIRSLPKETIFDPRLLEIRAKYFSPKTWSDNSIVFYCGSTAEVWGADTLDKGMGGSEEAVVYLSRELAKLGKQVTIYNERDEQYQDGKNITYLPWTSFNPLDNFNVFVAWRSPEFAKDIQAKLKLVDLHDVIDERRVIDASEYVDKFLVKSKYHRSLFSQVPDDKFAIIGNGIKTTQFIKKE